MVNNNYPNQYPNINRGVEALKAKTLEFIVVFEQFMTPAAKFADILLPVNTCLERNDITTGPTVGFYGFMGQAINSVGESKSHLEICMSLAERLGIVDYNDKTEDEWLRFIAEKHSIPDYDSFKEKGFYLFESPEPHVGLRPQIEDPENNKFPTPSGKIELFCQDIADIGAPDILPAVPKYIEMWEGVSDPLREKYPLQLLTPHSRKRDHSQLHEIPSLRKVEPHTIWINSADASARGIRDGDDVKVFNDRGTVLIPAKVTARVMPGVVCIYEGAWYSPDASGVDRGGCANVLTRPEPSPGGALCSNTSLVEVSKA